MNKWLIGILTSAIVLPTIVIFRDDIGNALAAGRDREGIQENLETLKDLYQEQKVVTDQIRSEQEHQKELNAVQIEALKELVREVKRSP